MFDPRAGVGDHSPVVTPDPGSAAEKAERERRRAEAATERDRAAQARAAAKAAVDEQHAQTSARTDLITATVVGFEDVLRGRSVQMRGRAYEVG